MRPRRQRKPTQIDDLDRILELLERVNARGDLDHPEIAERFARIKKLAEQLPAAAGNERLLLRIFKATKTELYEFSTTLIAKTIKELSS